MKSPNMINHRTHYQSVKELIQAKIEKVLERALSQSEEESIMPLLFSCLFDCINYKDEKYFNPANVALIQLNIDHLNIRHICVYATNQIYNQVNKHVVELNLDFHYQYRLELTNHKTYEVLECFYLDETTETSSFRLMK